MTVEANDTVERYDVNGTGPYAFSFRIFEETDLAVSVIEDATGDAALLTLDTQYSVDGVDDEDGGSVTLVAATAAQYASGYTLDIRSNTPIEQPTGLANQGAFRLLAIEGALDRQSRQLQDISRKVSAAVRAPDHEAGPEMELSPAESRANKYLVFDADGNPGVSAGTGSDSDLRDDLADDDASQGDNLVRVKYENLDAVALNLHDYIEDEAYNLSGFVPQNLKSALRDRSSTADISSYLQNAVDAVVAERTYGRVKLPSWRAYLESKITLAEGISIFGDGYYASDLILVGNIIGFEYAPGTRTEIAATFAHFTVRGESSITPLASHLMRFANCTGPTLWGMRLRSTADSCLKLETQVIGTVIGGNSIFESFTDYGVDLGSSCSVTRINGVRVNANAIAGLAFVGFTHADGADVVSLEHVNVNGANLLSNIVRVATGSTAASFAMRNCYGELLNGPCVQAIGTGLFKRATFDTNTLQCTDSVVLDFNNGAAHEGITVKKGRNGGATGGHKFVDFGSAVNFEFEDISVSAGITVVGYSGINRAKKYADGRIYLDGRSYGPVGPFTQANVAASQTTVALTGTRWVAMRAGSVTGVVVKSNEARTAGTATIEVYKNTGLAGAAGAGTGLTAVLNGSNPSVKPTTQAPNTETFAAGDEIYAVITTDAGWLPTTADIQVFIEVEC